MSNLYGAMNRREMNEVYDIVQKYKVEIDKVRVNGYDAYVLHEANLLLLFYTAEELQQYLEEVY